MGGGASIHDTFAKSASFAHSIKYPWCGIIRSCRAYFKRWLGKDTALILPDLAWNGYSNLNLEMRATIWRYFFSTQNALDMDALLLGPSALLQKRSHQLGDVGSFNSDDQRTLCLSTHSIECFNNTQCCWLTILHLSKYSCGKYFFTYRIWKKALYVVILK